MAGPLAIEKKTEPLCDCATIGQNRTDIVGRDVLEHVDAAHQIGGPRRTAFRESRIIGKIFEISFSKIVWRLFQILLSSAIVRKRGPPSTCPTPVWQEATP